MDIGQILRAISVFTLPILLAFTVPEIARGRVAMALGDKTPAPNGHLSLNPLHYVHVLGTVVLPVLMLLFGSPLLFGWAKSVPVDPRNFRKPRLDLALLSATAPIACLLMAWLWALLGGSLASRGLLGHGYLAYWVHAMAVIGLTINVFLAAINLLPIPPLAGGRMLIGVLPLKAAWALTKLEPYGFWIVLGLLFLESARVISVLGPLVGWLSDLIMHLVP